MTEFAHLGGKKTVSLRSLQIFFPPFFSLEVLPLNAETLSKHEMRRSRLSASFPFIFPIYFCKYLFSPGKGVPLCDRTSEKLFRDAESHFNLCHICCPFKATRWGIILQSDNSNRSVVVFCSTYKMRHKQLKGNAPGTYHVLKTLWQV